MMLIMNKCLILLEMFRVQIACFCNKIGDLSTLNVCIFFQDENRKCLEINLSEFRMQHNTAR